MKYIELDDPRSLPDGAIADDALFSFDCNPGVSCFNRCCHNLNLFLYPYDVIRLKQHLGLSSDQFLERHVDVVLRDGCFFPEVLLSMSETSEKPCPFLSPSGCSVYPHRPEACRMFPVEQGLVYDAKTRQNRKIHFFKPPEFCQGTTDGKQWTPSAWIKDQGAEDYNRMTQRWSELIRLFRSDPWAGEGPGGKRGKMAFMAAYNMGAFREFVFKSSFLKRYRIASARLDKVRVDDVELLKIGMAWIALFIWGKPSPLLKPR
jgi:Fe-S-cluster containining protein